MNLSASWQCPHKALPPSRQRHQLKLRLSHRGFELLNPEEQEKQHRARNAKSAHKYREKKKEYERLSKDKVFELVADVNRLQADNDDLRQRVEVLKGQLAKMRAFCEQKGFKGLGIAVQTEDQDEMDSISDSTTSPHSSASSVASASLTSSDASSASQNGEQSSKQKSEPKEKDKPISAAANTDTASKPRMIRRMSAPTLTPEPEQNKTKQTDGDAYARQMLSAMQMATTIMA